MHTYFQQFFIRWIQLKSISYIFDVTLKQCRFNTRPFYTLWQVNQYIFAWNVAAFNARNEVVTRNVFIALSPVVFLKQKQKKQWRREGTSPTWGTIYHEKRARIDFLLGWQPAPSGWSNMTNYCCPASVPSSLPLHAFPPVISHASTRPSVWSRRTIHEAFCEYGNQCVESRRTSVFTLPDTPDGER